MIDITLTVNGVDFTPDLLTYTVTEEISYDDIVVTMDGTETVVGLKKRDIILFTMMPSTQSYSTYYNALQTNPIVVSYTKPKVGTKNKNFRLNCDLEEVFLLKSSDNQNRYKSGQIILRCLEVG